MERRRAIIETPRIITEHCAFSRGLPDMVVFNNIQNASASDAIYCSELRHHQLVTPPKVARHRWTAITFTTAEETPVT